MDISKCKVGDRLHNTRLLYPYWTLLFKNETCIAAIADGASQPTIFTAHNQENYVHWTRIVPTKKFWFILYSVPNYPSLRLVAFENENFKRDWLDRVGTSVTLHTIIRSWTEEVEIE